MDQAPKQAIRSTAEPGIGSGTDNDIDIDVGNRIHIYRINRRTRDKHYIYSKK